MVPRGQKMTALRLGLPEHAPELSGAVELDHHCGLDRELGGASCPQAAPELALDKRLRSGMWSKLHMFLAEFTSGFMKIDFIISAPLSSDRFLVGDAWRVPRLCSSCRWRSGL